MFGRPKRKIQREDDRLKKQLAVLEDEAAHLHGEIKAIQSKGNSTIVGNAGEESDPRLLIRRRVVQPTRAQYRRKRNQAIILIIFAVLLLAWIVAKVWRGAAP